MTFNEKIDIENNIVRYSLKAKYNEDLTDDEVIEIETLHDYVRKIRFADIDFTANITMDSGTPTVTEDEAGDTVVEVSLGKVAPKEYILDENLEIVFSVDAGRINESDLNNVLTTKPIVSQARIAVFQAKIKEHISDILNEMRSEDNAFENESETIL